MKIQQFTRGLVDGWPSELRRGGGSVVVNADGTISLVGNLLLPSGHVFDWDGGDVTLTHSSAKLTWGGDGAVELDFNNHEMTNVDINSGAIDGTAIGAATRAAGNFSLVNVTGVTTISGDAGTGRIFRFSTAFVTRWQMLANTDSEGGANAGSNFSIDAFDDSGNLLGTALLIARATRQATFPNLITATAGVKLGTTVTLTEGAANLLALAAGDSLHIVSGAMGIGAAPSVNADLLLESGRLMLKESTTPTADTGYGKVYTKTDDKLYFQDGAGVEHTFSVSDYAAIGFDDNSSAETIDLKDLYHLVTRFTTNGLDEVSAADQANNRLTIGASRDYNVALCGSAQAAGGSKVFVFDVFEISQTTANITAITQATPGVVTAAGHPFSNGDLCKITGVVGMTEVNDKIYKVAGVSGADFSLQDDEGVSIATGGFGAWSSGGTVALATKTFAHSDRTFSNASGFGSFSSHWYYLATSGDAMEFAIKNKSDATDLTFEHLNLTVKAL